MLAQSCHSSLLLASFYMSKKLYVSGRSVPSEIRLMFKMLAALCGNAASVWRLGGEGWSAPLPCCVSESVQCQAAVGRCVCHPDVWEFLVCCVSVGLEGPSLASAVSVLFTAAGWIVLVLILLKDKRHWLQTSF